MTSSWITAQIWGIRIFGICMFTYCSNVVVCNIILCIQQSNYNGGTPIIHWTYKRQQWDLRCLYWIFLRTEIIFRIHKIFPFQCTGTYLYAFNRKCSLPFFMKMQLKTFFVPTKTVIYMKTAINLCSLNFTNSSLFYLFCINKIKLMPNLNVWQKVPWQFPDYTCQYLRQNIEIL